MKKSVIIIALLSVAVIGNSQNTEKQLPPFSLFEIPFYDWLGNGIMYSLINRSDGFDFESASFDYRSLLFDFIRFSDKKEYGSYPISQDYIAAHKIRAIYSGEGDFFETLPHDTLNINYTLNYTFDTLGRIQSFYDRDANNTWMHTCKYLKDNKVKVYVGNTLVSIIHFSDGKITYRKTTYPDKTYDKNTYEYYYSYTDFGYPSQIVRKVQWGEKAPISFEYDFGDTIKITRKKESGNDVFCYSWDGTLLKYNFLYNKKSEHENILYHHFIVNTVGDFEYATDSINNGKLKRVRFTEFSKYGYRSEVPHDYSATNADWYLCYQNDTLKNIASQVTSFYFDNNRNNAKAASPSEISFFYNTQYSLIQKFFYTDKNLRAITNDCTKLLDRYNRDFSTFYKIEYYQ